MRDETGINLSEIIQDLVGLLSASSIRGRSYAVTGTAGRPDGGVAATVCVTEDTGVEHIMEIEVRRQRVAAPVRRLGPSSRQGL